MLGRLIQHVITADRAMNTGHLVPECSHEDHGDQADQEDNHHETVKDGEPVDPVLEEGRVQVLVEPVLELNTFRSRFLVVLGKYIGT